MDNKSDNTTVQYLFFIIDENKFAVKAKHIKEIVDFVDIVKIPKANKAIKGVTNIRGDIVPVIDPNIRFGKGEFEFKARTSFIIFNILNEKKQSYSSIGLIVDLVVEVEEINVDDILDVPKFGTKISQEYIENMIRHEDEYITALDIDEVLSIEQLMVVK